MARGHWRLGALRSRRRAPQEGRARDGEAAQERATRWRRSGSRDAPSPPPSGARRGATIWKATATTRTACRAGAPTCATARWSTCRSRRGEVKAMVSGSSIYTVTVSIEAVPKAQWRSICRDCAGGIDSLVELLQGRFSGAVMERLCRQGNGLFPEPSEIRFSCSCPDSASMCKHVAAVLYGVGSRLDEEPELLFRLRCVDERDLMADLDPARALVGDGTGRREAPRSRRRLRAVRSRHGRRGGRRPLGKRSRHRHRRRGRPAPAETPGRGKRAARIREQAITRGPNPNRPP